jgi:GAF domain-containing protein
MDPRVEEALDRLDAMEGRPLPEYRDAITRELCDLTDSDISYFAVMDLDETVLTMIGWSQSAMANCGVPDRPIVYQLDETGLWGDAVRERRAVITNDYPNLDKPTKKGYPAGHVEIQRHMNLPIFEGDRVALVVGVGNKPDPYTEEDVELVEDLMTEAWETFQPALWQSTF